MNTPSKLLPLPALSADILDFVARCEILQLYIDAKLLGLAMNKRVAVYGAYISLAQEHFLSMLILVRKFCHASMAALARSHMEAICRGMWLYLETSQMHVDKVHRNEVVKFPEMKTMMAAIDKAYEADGFFLDFSRFGAYCVVTLTVQLSRRVAFQR